jgi:outer membrane receptor for monomeric catechols
VPVTPITANQDLSYEERSLAVTVNQLVGREWSFGARYRISDAELRQRFVTASPVPGGSQDNHATLQQLNLFGIYNHPSGFFARAESIWSQQSNRGYTPGQPGDDFWQFNLFAGWRFWQRRAEIQMGVLNLADQDYQLNPLNLYNELPRERTFVVRCKIYF